MRGTARLYTAYYHGWAPGRRSAAPRYTAAMALPNVLVQHLRTVAETRPAVAALYAFGSRIDGSARPDSDLDLGVLYVSPQPLEATVVLEEALHRVTGMAVDLTDVSRAGAFLAHAIVRGERLFAREPTAADHFELYVLRRAGDLLPFERERRAMLLAPKP